MRFALVWMGLSYFSNKCWKFTSFSVCLERTFGKLFGKNLEFYLGQIWFGYLVIKRKFKNKILILIWILQLMVHYEPLILEKTLLTELCFLYLGWEILPVLYILSNNFKIFNIRRTLKLWNIVHLKLLSLPRILKISKTWNFVHL